VSVRIGIDVGGTFTDFLVVDDDGGRQVHKTSSVPSNPAQAVLTGLTEIAAARGISLADFLAEVVTIVHGTTVSTNALLTRRGAKVGLLVTEGFRDTLTLRDGRREEPYDNRLPMPTPLVSRELTRPIRGRVDWSGREVEQLVVDDVRAAAAVLRDSGVEAVAICFMHSYANAEHEREAARVIAAELPDVYLTTSHDLLAQVRYYPRTSTTVLNAYAGPIISDYLATLTSMLQEARFSGLLLLMQSNGGVATPEELARRAALSLLSGPASGPTAGLLVVEPHNLDRCITIDMGGTSFDAAVVDNGEPLVMTDGIVDRWAIALPMVDIHTIGAGGGSIAYVDEGGLLRVGPQSAGASPGPVCYGRGGTLPTTTDADVVLGFVDPDSFLHGGMRLDRDAAYRAIEEHVAKPLGIDVIAAAAGIYDVVNVNMAAGVREITVRRGLDPRDFPLVVAGGAGPVHAAAIASELGVPSLITPRESSIFCAAGMLVCDFKHDFVRSYKTRLSDLDTAELAALWAEMAAAGLEILRGEGLADADATFAPALDMRYKGQWYELTVPFDAVTMGAPDPSVLGEGFGDMHDRLFGYRTDEMPIDILNVRLSVVGRTPKPTLRLSDGIAEQGDPRIGTRSMWSSLQRSMVDAGVYDGRRMGPGATLAGPAVVELGTTSIVVPDEFDLVVDDAGSFVSILRERAEQVRKSLEGLTSPARPLA